MIVGAKKLADQALLLQDERVQLYENGDAMIAHGAPAEIPAALPSGLLIRLLATLQRYDNLLTEVVNYDAGFETHDEAALIERWDGLRAKARALQSPLPSLVQPSRVLIPKE